MRIGSAGADDAEKEDATRMIAEMQNWDWLCASAIGAAHSYGL